MGHARKVRGAIVFAIGMATLGFAGTAALADDPRDPTMTPEAIARDRAVIRRLNQDQLAYVRQRDAGYAQGWAAHARGRDDDDALAQQAASDDAAYTADRRDYAAMRSDYVAQRRAYEQDMKAWRADVAACRAGDYDRCDG